MLNGVWSIYTMANTNGLDFGVIPFPKLFDKTPPRGAIRTTSSCPSRRTSIRAEKKPLSPS
jgi:maltose-binding protein MalE